MKNPNFSIDLAQGFVVLSDQETCSNLDECMVVLVDGDFNAKRDGAVSEVLRECDIARFVSKKASSGPTDPMIPMEVTTERNEHCKVRTISVEALLKFYLDCRTH